MFGFLEKRRQKTQVVEEALLSVSHFKHSVCVRALSQWLQREQETDEELCHAWRGLTISYVEL